ncbi:MAG TPA: chemotaxis protein CheW [Longimicrobiaceae bacterium]|nr:chemotaxis protein CheW [Longimicrobiaceae bacterium]
MSQLQTPDAASETSPAGAGEASPERIVLLGVGGHWFGVRIGSIREIIPPRPYTPLPGSEAHVCGLINLRGRIVTVVDLGARLGLRAASAHPEHSVVVLEHGGRLVGMAVEEVSRIVHADLSGLEVGADLLRSLRIDRSYLLGVGETDDRIFVAVDPDEIFRPILA